MPSTDVPSRPLARRLAFAAAALAFASSSASDAQPTAQPGVRLRCELVRRSQKTFGEGPSGSSQPMVWNLQVNPPATVSVVNMDLWYGSDGTVLQSAAASFTDDDITFCLIKQGCGVKIGDDYYVVWGRAHLDRRTGEFLMPFSVRMDDAGYEGEIKGVCAKAADRQF